MSGYYCIIFVYVWMVTAHAWLIPHWQVARSAPRRREQNTREIAFDSHLEELLSKVRRNEFPESNVASEEERYLFRRITNECVLGDDMKFDCGFLGITESGCVNQGCCWAESKVSGVPWCFHPQEMERLSAQCTMQDDNRDECGWFGIKKTQCRAQGCCWRRSKKRGVPWCFRKKRKQQTQEVVPPVIGECGVPAVSPALIGRIVGGRKAKAHSWPWMVSVQGHEHFCGGSLLNEQWVLTAAHCKPGFDWSDEKLVKVGIHSQSQESPNERTIEIAKIFSHLDYDSDTYNNDLMLLKLAEKVEFNTHVMPVCLPSKDQKLIPGTRCYVTGWGHTSFMGREADVLQQIMVPILETSTCNQKTWYDGKITENMICAGYHEGGKDSCQGDSGGPLVCYTDDRWVLFGVVSWGEGCAGQSKPGVYARVTRYLDWIDIVMKNNS